jgi:biopolymer transport protein ExbB/biopolymer transport protein TolQ
MGMDWSEILAAMGVVAWTVVGILTLMSLYIIMAAIERALTYRESRKQARAYAPELAERLRNGDIDGAIALGEQYPKGYLAKALTPGLMEMKNSKAINDESLESTARAIERATAIVIENKKKSLSHLATIGSTAPFVGLFGTTVGIINAFQGMAREESAGIGAVAGGISEALVATAYGLLVAIPAVWFYNLFTNKLEIFIVEMDNSTSELLDYFAKKRS